MTSCINLKIRFISLIITITVIACNAIGGETIPTLLHQARSEKVFLPPSQQELLKAETLFAEMFKGRISPETEKAWTDLNFTCRRITENNRPFIVLFEAAGHREGRGFFLFSAQPVKEKIAFQFPHSFKDIYTGDIGLAIVLEGDYAGAAWNTVPREFTLNGHTVNADLSDHYNTFFAAFARAFAGSYPDGYLIQIHGFAKNKRKTAAGKASDIIISSGTSVPGKPLVRLDTCLENQLNVPVSLYPFEVSELGATQTSIGGVLRQMNHPGFVHIEMSHPLRSILKNTPEQRKRLAHCFLEILK